MNMASQSQQSTSQHWDNIPPEILGLILTYLGKHDLLNVRMVSHSWNDESLKVLRKSKFTQVLRESNMKEYICFTTPSGPRKFIIPFHLNFNIDAVLVEFSAVDQRLKSLTSYVDSLCKIFGPQCVSTFTLTTDPLYNAGNILDIDLNEFLVLISPGLKTLDLTRFISRINFQENQNCIESFPNLKTLICNTSLCKTGKSGPEIAYISIIENSPKLEDLTLTHPCDLEPWPLNFNQLKSLSLESMIHPQNILDKILTSSGLPVLRELSLVPHVPGKAEDKLLVYNILQAVSPTLKSLKFREPMHFRNSGYIGTIISLPKLPHLEHLGFEYNGGRRCWLHPVENFSEETLPTLKSIELQIGFIFTQSEDDDVHDVGIKFPNLNKLILRVYSGSDELNGPLEQLQQIFPNPSILSLVNVGGNDGVKYLLKRIMKSNWSKNIQELGMIGFRENYLGQFFEEMEFSPRIVFEKCNGISGDMIRREVQYIMRKMRMKCVETVDNTTGIIVLTRAPESDSMKMTNLTTIKLVLMDGSNPYNLNNSQLSSIIPNLTCLGEHFPQLRMIEISGLRFNQKDLDTWRTHTLEFKSKFPSVVLNVP